jgi:hypothetical protein
MAFDLLAYSPAVRDILSLDGEGDRPIPLVAKGCSSSEAAKRIRRLGASGFPGGRSPEGALSGLWLYFSAFHEAHEVAQGLPSKEGDYWHAIVHRVEPDAGNASYWFRKLGKHAVFAGLAAIVGDRYRQAGWTCGSSWDPLAFLSFCDAARAQPGSAAERAAMEIQLIEWQLLFDYCARPPE